MQNVASVCLTIEIIWTSVVNENDIAVTAHFLNDNFELDSGL